MPYVSVGDLNAWTDQVKLDVTEIDEDLLDAQVTEVLAGVAAAYDTSTWLDDSDTPSLVKKIIAMMYVGWFYQRTYSEDDNVNSYGLMLIARAQALITGIVAGTIVLPDAPVGSATNIDSPVFYPTDASSGATPTFDDMSLGGPAFSMGQIW